MPGSAGEADGPRHSLDLVVPCEEKRNSDGELTRKKVRVTAAGLVSNGEIASTFAANSAADVPGSAGDADGPRHPGAGFV